MKNVLLAFALILPTFQRSVLLEQTSETGANVSLGDLDGDGDRHYGPH